MNSSPSFGCRRLFVVQCKVMGPGALDVVTFMQNSHHAHDPIESIQGRGRKLPVGVDEGWWSNIIACGSDPKYCNIVPSSNGSGLEVSGSVLLT